jgi:hypothetical protein
MGLKDLPNIRLY